MHRFLAVLAVEKLRDADGSEKEVGGEETKKKFLREAVVGEAVGEDAVVGEVVGEETTTQRQRLLGKNARTPKMEK